MEEKHSFSISWSLQEKTILSCEEGEWACSGTYWIQLVSPHAGSPIKQESAKQVTRVSIGYLQPGCHTTASLSSAGKTLVTGLLQADVLKFAV